MLWFSTFYPHLTSNRKRLHVMYNSKCNVTVYMTSKKKTFKSEDSSACIIRLMEVCESQMKNRALEIEFVLSPFIFEKLALFDNFGQKKIGREDRHIIDELSSLPCLFRNSKDKNFWSTKCSWKDKTFDLLTLRWERGVVHPLDVNVNGSFKFCDWHYLRHLLVPFSRSQVQYRTT